MEKQVYSLRLCRNYFKWLNRLLLFYSIIKSDLYVIMMNKLNCSIEIKCTLFINCRCCITTSPRINKYVLLSHCLMPGQHLQFFKFVSHGHSFS